MTDQGRVDKIVQLNTKLVDELKEMNTNMDWLLKEVDRIYENIQNSLYNLNNN